MRTHAEIDARSLALARAVAARIDADPAHAGLDHARAVCRRWSALGVRAAADWQDLLARAGWPEIRRALLDDSEEGRQRRQNSPFCGILTPRERWALYREFQHHDPRTA